MNHHGDFTITLEGRGFYHEGDTTDAYIDEMRVSWYHLTEEQVQRLHMFLNTNRPLKVAFFYTDAQGEDQLL